MLSRGCSFKHSYFLNKMFKDKCNLSKGIRKNRGKPFFMAGFLFELRLALLVSIILGDYLTANSQVAYQNFRLLTLRGISSATLGYPFYFTSLKSKRSRL